MENVVPDRYEGRNRWGAAAAVLCFALGVCLILNIHPIGDGLWFWYATAIREHLRLYSDLHFNMQPLFVLVTAAFQALLGPSWLAFKVFPALQLLVFCAGLLLVSRATPYRRWQQALLILAAFCLTNAPRLARFDDYHITTQNFLLFAILAMLMMLKRPQLKTSLWLTVALGALAGLTLSNRLNDGAALFLACAIAMPALASTRRVLHLVVLGATAGLVLLTIVLLTGDSVTAWFTESIVHAARIKGGSGGLLASASAFPVRLAQALISGRHLKYYALLGVAALFAGLPYALAWRQGRYRKLIWTLVAVILFALQVRFLMLGAGHSNIALILAIALCGLGLWAQLSLAVALLRGRLSDWPARRALLLIPFWALFSDAMSAGNALPEFFSPSALFILVLPIAFAEVMTQAWLRRTFLVILWLSTISILNEKRDLPYTWHHYHDGPLFSNRVWYDHPDFGPMYIEKDQLAFMLPICKIIHDSGPGTDLLSMPFPYANYFCDVPPWHRYIQTWFDTVDQQTIEKLEGELAVAPPRYIVYQRNLDSLPIHEHNYNGDRPLAHRYLDAEIFQEIAAHRWTIVSRSCFGGADWLLIRTGPPAMGEHVGSPADAVDRGPTCPNRDVG